MNVAVMKEKVSNLGKGTRAELAAAHTRQHALEVRPASSSLCSLVCCRLLLYGKLISVHVSSISVARSRCLFLCFFRLIDGFRVQNALLAQTQATSQPKT